MTDASLVEHDEATKREPDPRGHELVTAHNGSSPFVGKHVVVRTYSAGVHLGELVSRDGTYVLLRNARRLWKWNGAFTLSEVATTGVRKTGSRIAVALPEIELTQAIEIFPTTAEARATFDAVHE
jgi:hypothetical protein